MSAEKVIILTVIIFIGIIILLTLWAVSIYKKKINKLKKIFRYRNWNERKRYAGDNGKRIQ